MALLGRLIAAAFAGIWLIVIIWAVEEFGLKGYLYTVALPGVMALAYQISGLSIWGGKS
jgi:hypothetical protein